MKFFLAQLMLIIFLYLNEIHCWAYNPLCWIKECCFQDHIPADTAKLRAVLRQRVYGQHLVNIAVEAIEAHWKSDVSPSKALVLSFHGWPGSGKNYVANFIADSLFKYGTESKFVHQFVGRLHFPLEEHTQRYKEELYSWLKGNISSCPKQLFIFDEIDKMPSGVLNALTPIIDYRSIVDGVDFRQSIFILLSNTGSMHIINECNTYWKNGGVREDLSLNHFENIIKKGAFNEKGGFHYSDTIKSNLIDHYVPFLPMEHGHITECIKDQFRERGIFNPKEEHINEVMEIIEWGPDDTKRFSKTGCKRISSKVGVLATRYPKPKKEL